MSYWSLSAKKVKEPDQSREIMKAYTEFSVVFGEERMNELFI